MAQPNWLEPLEQTAHFWMGFWARLVYLDLLLWHREAVKQWPPRTDKQPIVYLNVMEPNHVAYCSLVRAEDTMRDLFWMGVGATCAELVRWPVVGFLIWKFA